jgi:hypothetical protein
MEPPDHELESITRTSLRVCYGKRQPRGRHGHVLRFLAASCSCAPSWNTLTHPSPAAAGTHPSASCWVIHINVVDREPTARGARTSCFVHPPWTPLRSRPLLLLRSVHTLSVCTPHPACLCTAQQCPRACLIFTRSNCKLLVVWVCWLLLPFTINNSKRQSNVGDCAQQLDRDRIRSTSLPSLPLLTCCPQPQDTAAADRHAPIVFALPLGCPVRPREKKINVRKLQP